MSRNATAGSHPWLRDFLRTLGTPILLTREEFTATYYPSYVGDYQPSYAIRLRPDGRPTRVTPGNIRAQQTKRDNILDAAFAAYLSDFNASYNQYKS